MVPIRLKLRNFMAYREADLDFEGIHLAVLTGENGAGKSSLLDAITWVLWGKARAKRDDELIYLGQAEMEVEHTFGLGGNVYRVIRKRDASGRGRSSLDFHIEDAGGWRTLTETSLRVTQQKINDLLRLDYDTFINSAFLLQGRADEFTTKPPGKRKEILGDILGLGIYDTFEQRAKERAVAKEREGTSIIARVEQIEQELAREPEYRTELAAAEQEAAELSRQLQLAEKEMDVLREQHRAINDKQRQLDDLCDRLTKAEADLAEIAAEMAEAKERIDEYRALLQRQAEIETGLESLRRAREAVKDWDHRLQESAKLSTRKHELDTAFNTARAEVEANLREIMAKIDLLSPKLAGVAQQRDQLTQAQAELDVLQVLAQQRESNQATLTNLKEESARLKEQNRQLKVEMDEIKTNLTQLAEADSNCPVCQRPLDEEHRTKVLAQFQAEGTQKGDMFRANQNRLREIATRQETLQTQLTEAERQLRSLAAVQGQVARLRQALEDAEAAADDLAQAQAQQTKLQKRLETQEFAAEVVAALAEVKAELATLGYDEAAHQQARAEVERFSYVEEEARVLAEAEKRIAEEEKRLEREQTRRNRLAGQTSADRQRVTELEQETTGLPDLVNRLNQASAEVNRRQREERFARDKVAAAHQKLNYVAGLAKQRGEQEDKLQQIREMQGIFRELQQAFGKKGVQALLIESAIPEIEDEVNRLLGRMTDSRMHVRFETQREAKSSDSTIETLDIRISDEVGTRDYEMYSGGEAFRVNFAIRVALSKVLARRAGAQLQTLVIDEGFGTQDGQGRERLVEAINSIQDDFEKIIVITHIDELKDAFPVRIDVWKTPEGSQVAIR
ncbi:MAG: SMC family ATPase [Anaerolineae bacterium]|nr:SMC family ATPase [Anaerolineae bacterium]